MQLRQAAALHHARYRGGFHYAASLAAAQAGMKFAIAHNIPAFGQTKKTTPFHRIWQSYRPEDEKVQGYINEVVLFVFSGASALTFHPRCAFGA
jgi:D-tyrosyl-tRNA(Tyr) deacylase